MKRILSFVAVLVSLWFVQPQGASAQGTPSEGKDFYLGFLYPSYQTVVPSTSAPFFKVYVLISSFQDNTAYLSYFDKQSGLEMGAASYPIKKRQTVQIPIVVPNMQMTDPGDLIKEYCALHIFSKKPINVQFFSSGSSSCGSYLALPTSGLGNKYVIASYNDNPDGQNAQVGGRGPSTADVACGYFMVIAPFDGTTVSITPTSTTQGGRHIGVLTGPGASGSPQPYSISLNRGQCYMVKSWCGGSDNDITGTTVESTNPVVVIAGHEDAALGGVSGRPLEGRDYMVEQMVPSDFWDSTGYVSMPLVDSSPLGPNDEGPGDNYRVYTNDQNGAQIQAKKAGFGGSIDLSIAKYTNRELFEVEVPTHFYSTDGHKFGVMLYDQANQSSTAPFPRPSMMTIIPMSRWRNAYLWFVPPNLAGERIQSYYVNVIGPKAQFDTGIHVSKNGGAEVSVGSVGQSMGSYLTFPDHPELKGVRYKISSGVTYYARANFPFTVYSYGNRAVDFDGDLGDFDNDDNFFAYALPVGMVLTDGTPPNMTIKVDTLCSSWKVTVTDHRIGGGIKSAVLLDDPYGDIVVPPFIDSTDKTKRDTVLQQSGKAGFQYVNSSLDPLLDPLGTREIIFSGNDTVVSFEVRVDNVSKDAYAPVYITDNKGNPKMVAMTFQKSLVKYDPQPDTDCYFGLHYILDMQDSTFKFMNLASSKKSYSVDKVELLKNDPAFQIVDVRPPLKATIKPGDTLFIKVRFTAIDTTIHFDTVKMVTDCFTSLTPVSGEGGTPLIVASDHDFGNVGVGSKKCVDTISVWNLGKLPFILTKDYKLFDDVNFSIDTTYPQPNGLPTTIPPGKFVKMRFCYKPTKEGTDTTRNDWGTDIRAPYEHSIKDYTILRGNGIKPGVVWDRPKDSMVVLCDSSLIHRIYLLNNATAPSHVKDVYINGSDGADFTIVQWQLGQPTYDFFIDTGAMVWFDVKFKADLGKTYQLRQAYLNASTWDDTAVRKVNMRGWVQIGTPLVGPRLINLGIIPFGKPDTTGFTLQNTGDGTLYINSIIIPKEIRFIPMPTLPITIQPGDIMSFTIDVTSDIYVDTTIMVIFQSESFCTKKDTLLVHYLVSKREVIPAGFAAPDTYVDCRENNGTVSLSNRGTTAINLQKIEFISEPPTYVDPDQFVFQSTNNQVLTYTPAKVLDAGKTETVPVIFKPTRTGSLATKVRFVYDSAGKLFDTVYAINTGTGVKLKNTFTAANPADPGGKYNIKTGDFFDVPIKLTDAIENQAGVYGTKFTVTYRRDVINYLSAVGENGQSIVGSPAVTRDGSGNETLTIETKGGQVPGGVSVASIHFQSVVATEKKTDIVVNDGEMHDNAGAVLCYFDKQYIPAVFEPIYQCGDSSLSKYLGGTFKATHITHLSPNPSNGTGKVEVSYDVNVKDLPVTIELFNVMGEKVKTLVANKAMTEGKHTLSISAKDIPAGTYTVRISANNDTESENFVITK